MKSDSPRIVALIVAAGQGSRAGGGVAKQWRLVAGRRVAAWTAQAFAAHPAISDCLFVINPSDAPFLDPSQRWVAGADSRAGSVLAGLTALAADPPDFVLIHDVARPCVSAQTIEAVIAALQTADGAAPALAVTDALWRTNDQKINGTASRDGLLRAQTPQGFAFSAILQAHQVHPGGAADDVEVACAAGLTVAPVPGDEDNIKITTAADFDRAARILERKMQVRLGNGYDVHRFGPGDHVMLCGVSVAHDRGLQGHSDADVGMHALTDALYGAMAQGDIGRHFPPSDPQWRGADSAVFLRHAIGLARDLGFELSNADVTLVCEAPKIGPHASAMQARLADIMGVDVGSVSVKATTSERLGFTGRGEGVAALATAALTGQQ